MVEPKVLGQQGTEHAVPGILTVLQMQSIIFLSVRLGMF